MFEQCLVNVKKTTPLVHCITNYVTVNDCANILLASGASPIMSDDPNEVAEITTICGGLAINIGTLNQNTVPSMFLAGKQADGLRHPLILDPVGAGASKLRTQTALKLIQEMQFTVIRGNVSEIKTLASGSGTTQGVDADVADRVTEENLQSMVSFAKNFAKQTKAIIVMTGAIDIVADSEKAYVIRNGHPMMARITGSGCMLTVLIAAYLVANPENLLTSTAAAVCALGLAGEGAYAKVQAKQAGNGTFRIALIDEIDRLTGQELKEGARYEVY